MGRTEIEWTDHTWQPGIFGCAEISPACAHCYAAKMAHRLVGVGVYPEGITTKRASGVHWSGAVRLATLEQLSTHARDTLPKKKVARVFTTSMSDLFLDEVTDDFLYRVFAEMALRPHLTFQVLTKRPSRALRFFEGPTKGVFKNEVEQIVQGEAEHVAHRYLDFPHFHWDERGSAVERYSGCGPFNEAPGERSKRIAQRRAWPGWPLPNVWLGCTVEDQARADERIPLLLQIPAAVRFLSCEPLLGPISLDPWIWGNRCPDPQCGDSTYDHRCRAGLQRLHWVIAGGESGQGARPSHPDWLRSLRDQCSAAGVPFLFKQWGEWREATRADLDWRSSGKSCAIDPSGRAKGQTEAFVPPADVIMLRAGKKATGRLLDGVEHNAFPKRWP